MDCSSLFRVLQQLSFREGVAVICASAVAAHGVFKIYEPSGMFTHALLIFAPPAVLANVLCGQLHLLGALAVSFAVYCTTLVFSILVYRLSPFHPLARYPGPMIMKMSKLWAVKINADGYQHRYIEEAHEKYGDVVRIGPNELSIRDASVIEPMYGVSGLPKGPMWVGRATGSANVPIIGVREPGPHALRRKAWNRGLSVAAIKDREETIAGRVMQLVDHLDTLAPSEIMLSQWVRSLLYDIMGDMSFGGGLEMMRDGDTTGLMRIMDRGILMQSLLGHIPWAGLYFQKLFSNGASDMRAVAHNLALNRIKSGSHARDLFYYLNNEDGAEDRAPPLTQVVPDGTLVIIAGSDTTSSTLTCLFSSLMRHPDTYKRLQAEVDRFYPAGEDACNPRHYLKMTYLTAVINEVLRLYPAVPPGSQRSTATIPGGKLVGPVYLPEGTQASVHTYSLQRDPHNFSPYPGSFWPERWLLAAGDTTVKLPPGTTFVHNTTAYVPFSYGPMNCPGRALALLQMRMLVCTLVQRFVMRLPKHYDAGTFHYELKEMFVWETPNFPVVLERRVRMPA